MNESTVPISSVKRSYEIIDTIRNRGRAGVTELSESLEYPKSTVHNHLQTLEQLGYIVKTEEKYRLSTRYFHIGREVRTTHEVFRHGIETAKRLERESNRHVQLVIEENGIGAILFATHWRRDNYTRASDQLSLTRVHLHANAPGKAILAQLPDERLSSIIERYGLPSRTEETITTEQALQAELETVRRQGYAIDRGEMINGSMGIGAVIKANDHVYGAIAVYGPTGDIAPEIEDGTIISLINEHAETIQTDLIFGSTN